MSSLWIQTTKKPMFEALKENIKTDVLIIGGGLAGILCAYMLQKSGIDYVLLEAKEICSGVTQNTTAKITVQHGLIYDNLIKKYGVNYAKGYLEANKIALDEYKKLCKEFDCNFEEKDAIVYSLNDKNKIVNELNAYRTLGVSAELTSKTELPINIVDAVKIKGQGQINPIEFLYKISKDLNIKENTKIIELQPNIARTNNNTINFKKAIITTHFPILNKHGAYFLKMYQHRSYVIALENAQNLSAMYIDGDKKGLSFRTYKNLLLLGGGSHRTGKKGGSYTELFEFVEKYYPNAKIKYKWATQDCMTLDSVPYIGKYSNNTPYLYTATGFNKWGFTTAMVAAKLLCDEIKNTKNDYAEIFKPSRSIMHPQLLVNGFESVTNLLTPTAPRCPHLGCALKYNKQEHSWDCPCHGSRFSADGKLIDNPATDDINI